jgi:hypothetical protein
MEQAEPTRMANNHVKMPKIARACSLKSVSNALTARQLAATLSASTTFAKLALALLLLGNPCVALASPASGVRKWILST